MMTVILHFRINTPEYFGKNTPWGIEKGGEYRYVFL